jgi:uncharacterized coiled-coil protein SlyX
MPPQEAEIATLRARVADLESQLAAQQQATAALVAEAQEKLYWLERWHVDLDRVMRKPGALRALEALRSARQLVWKGRRLKRRFLG